MAETCWACEFPMAEVGKGDDIALCTRHWNWWLTRWLNSADEPPCGAHLILTDESLITAMDRHRERTEPGGSVSGGAS